MSCSIESYGDLSSLCDNVGLDSKKLVSINQVHSSKIISVKRAGHYESSDGIINFGGNLVCSIKVADCLPIYFINRISRTIGLVHAGWRGLSLGIINEYINNVKKNNERASDNYVFIGPSIKKCCFTIQNDVLNHFDSRFYSKINDKHYQVDLQEWAVNQIMNLNIKNDKIFVIDKCTYCNKDLYESFRRDGDCAGRMYALLGWLE
jgi:polyphenol oxidase